MRLLAVNKTWAVYDNEDAGEPFDAYEALRDLLKVGNYRQLISYLLKHTRNNAFANSVRDYDTTFRNYTRVRWGRVHKIHLQGDLERAINAHADLDYLDDLTIADLAGRSTNELALHELSYFQGAMRRFLTLAAVASGSPAPAELFYEVPTTSVFDREWCESELPCDPGNARTFVIMASDIPIDDNGLFASESFMYQGMIFSYIDARSGQRSAYTDATIKRFSPRGRKRKGSVCVDGVVYGWYEPHRDESDPVYEHFQSTEDCLTVTAPEGVAEADAKRMFAGRIVETLVNCGINEKLYDLTYPVHGEGTYERYGYDAQAGVLYERIDERPKAWFEQMYDLAVDLALDGKVALCPVCGSPVLVRDLRGRKPREVYSDTCKTVASNQRRATAMALAMDNVPVEDAIRIIGEEYEASVRKWYSQTTAIPARKGGLE
ncbi:MAG: hypothetical protein IJ087_04135 [Eggerthellaceae bacterium]|nr:hypothetical protein [Eggerthellaceae bacterium]